MSQNIFTNIDPSTTSGNALATLLNDFKNAIVTGFSGTSRPANLQAGGYWIDTTLDAAPDYKWVYKMWTGTIDIEIFSINKNTGVMSITGTSGSYEISQISADNVGAILKFVKSRIANNGQSLIGDVLGNVEFLCTTDTGTEVVSARVKSVALDNATGTQSGAYLSFEVTTDNAASPTEVMRLVDGKLAIGTTTPEVSLHVKSLTGMKHEIEEDTTTGASLDLKKKRVATNGQVLSGDKVATIKMSSTDDAGSDFSVVEIVSTATQNHTSTNRGVEVSVAVNGHGSSTKTEVLKLNTIVEAPTGLKSKSVVVGSNVTAANNVKFNRAANGKLQAVPANDTTAEGTEATALAALDFTFPGYTFAGKPAAGNAGRIIYLTDQKILLLDDGTNWKVSGGAGGGSSLVFKEGDNPPQPDVDAALNSVRKFVAGDTQNLIVAVKVPKSFGGGQQIKISMLAAAGNNTGNYLLNAVSTLIRTGTDAIDSTTNQRTTTNTAIAAANKVYKEVLLDITDSSGNINGVAVSANDIILVTLKRSTDTSTSDVSLLDTSAELLIG